MDLFEGGDLVDGLNLHRRVRHRYRVLWWKCEWMEFQIKVGNGKFCSCVLLGVGIDLLLGSFCRFTDIAKM